MRLYECDQCKSVNRIAEFRLDKQPVCGACGREIVDFPLCRPVRRAWKHKELIFFAMCCAGVFAAIGADQYVRGSAPPAVIELNRVLVADTTTGVAPFAITAPLGGNGVYVKLVYAKTTRPHLELYVNAGTRFATTVGLGNYEIMYATGDRWLGLQQAENGNPFWGNVSRFKFDDVFSFTSTNDGYSGNEVYLIEQRNGNLSKTPISATDFGD